jgi:hypothetical protein
VSLQGTKQFRPSNNGHQGLETALRERGVVGSGGYDGTFSGRGKGVVGTVVGPSDHQADLGARVDVPTRAREQKPSYTIPGKEKRRMLRATPKPGREMLGAGPKSGNPGSVGGSGRMRNSFRELRSPVDDYAMQEKLRRDMVMGQGSGCRGKMPNKPGSKPERKPAPFKATNKSSGLFDEHANADTGPPSPLLPRSVLWVSHFSCMLRR